MPTSKQLHQEQQTPHSGRRWDVNDTQLPMPTLPDPFEMWPDGHCCYAYGGRLDEAKRHTSGWAMRNTNNHNVSILKKSCLGVLVCSRGCLGASGTPLSLRPAICDKARKKQCGKPCPNAKCDGVLMLQACRGHSGYPVTHFWRHLNGCVYFQAKGAHDHAAPDLKPSEQIRRRLRMYKRGGAVGTEPPDAVKAADLQPQNTPQRLQKQPRAKCKRKISTSSGLEHPQMPLHHHHPHHHLQQHPQQQQQSLCTCHRVEFNQCQCRSTSRQASSHNQHHLQPAGSSASSAVAAAAAAAAALFGAHEAAPSGVLHYPRYASAAAYYTALPPLSQHHEQLHHDQQLEGGIALPAAVEQQQHQQLHRLQHQLPVSQSPPVIDPVADFADPFFAFWQSGGGGGGIGGGGYFNSPAAVAAVYGQDQVLIELKPHRTRRQYRLEEESNPHFQQQHQHQHQQQQQQQQHQHQQHQQQHQHQEAAAVANQGSNISSAFLPFSSISGPAAFEMTDAVVGAPMLLAPAAEPGYDYLYGQSSPSPTVHVT